MDVSLMLTNTLTQRKETFQPIDVGHVRLYVCGPTVYDYAHIGNARPVVVFDILYRHLRYLFPQVTYVRNITDVDDKIIEASRRTGDPIDMITTRTTIAYQEDMRALGALDPDIEPRATAHIDDMVAMIDRLIDLGHAYVADGHVLFHVPSMAGYGALSRRDRDGQIAGARVEVASYKKDPADFVLWKPAEPADPGWESPWGRGRPGWHIECSAMSARHLGPVFDIHGGGQDLVFPHHENELAQSRCAHGTDTMARYWIHNGYVMVEGEKMSKSLGNFRTVHDLRDRWPGEVIRLVLISAQYRQPLDFTEDGLRQAKSSLDRLYGALRQGRGEGGGGNHGACLAPDDPVITALNDDLNTPQALAILHETAGEANRSEGEAKRRTLALLKSRANHMGLLTADPEDWFQHGPADEGPTAEEIEAMIVARHEARKTRDFKEADRIRDTLAGNGVILEDGPAGTTWKRT